MKRPSLFLYIKIKPENKRGFVLVLPLFVIEMIFQGLVFWKHIFVKAFNKKIKRFNLDVDKLIELISAVWMSITSYRDHYLVNVEARDVEVKIKVI